MAVPVDTLALYSHDVLSDCSSVFLLSPFSFFSPHTMLGGSLFLLVPACREGSGFLAHWICFL
jgi:hypothetical protein